MAEIVSVKFTQPLSCKCGRQLSSNDVRSMNERFEVVCMACHASALEIEYELEEPGY